MSDDADSWLPELERLHAAAMAIQGDGKQYAARRANPIRQRMGGMMLSNAPRILAMLRAGEKMREALEYCACSEPPDFPCARPKLKGGKCLDSLSGDCGLPAAQALAAYDAAKGE